MRRFLALVLAAILALMPLAGVATDVEASVDREMPCHSQDTSDENAPASCADMKGCCAAVLAPAFVPLRARVALDERAVPVSSLTSGFVPDPADRPPVS